MINVSMTFTFIEIKKIVIMPIVIWYLSGYWTKQNHMNSVFLSDLEALDASIRLKVYVTNIVIAQENLYDLK